MYHLTIVFVGSNIVHTNLDFKIYIITHKAKLISRQYLKMKLNIMHPLKLSPFFSCSTR